MKPDAQEGVFNTEHYKIVDLWRATDRHCTQWWHLCEGTGGAGALPEAQVNYNHRFLNVVVACRLDSLRFDHLRLAIL